MNEAPTLLGLDLSGIVELRGVIKQLQLSVFKILDPGIEAGFRTLHLAGVIKQNSSLHTDGDN